MAAAAGPLAVAITDPCLIPTSFTHDTPEWPRARYPPNLYALNANVIVTAGTELRRCRSVERDDSCSVAQAKVSAQRDLHHAAGYAAAATRCFQSYSPQFRLLQHVA